MSKLEIPGRIRASHPGWHTSPVDAILSKSFFGEIQVINGKFFIKIDGTWRKFGAYVKNSGHWKAARSVLKREGRWQPEPEIHAVAEYIDARSTNYVRQLPSGIQEGDWMVIALHMGNTIAGMGVNGWTELLPSTAMNTRRIGIWAKRKELSDTSVEIVWPAVSAYMRYALCWGSGAPLSYWQIGALELRGSYGGAPRNWARCPSVNVANDKALALAFAFEATNAVEVPDSILSSDNEFEQVIYTAQGNTDSVKIETIWVGKKYLPHAGATGVTTVLYRNPQDSNGAGIHVIIPQQWSQL